MGSRVPEVIDRLLALGAADSALKGVRVSDGPELTEDDDPEWLIPGWDADPNGDYQAASTLGGWAGLGSRREEQFQITVAVIAFNGDTDVRAARERAYEIAYAVEAWFAADPSIGLPELEAAIEASQLTQDQTDKGAKATLLLTVAGRGFT
ncbi:hypothetical protein ACFWMH_22035 [Streptomyces tendae]|uniref:hypothetical protein n=1 Tax=Streptomyces tendae TaxID=1932 RepID=UPI00167A63FF|nr:hypothetical protein [Streptomyces tendae]GHA61087.1 hypothetical protein GCM10010330_11220 [Streptomyces tendae]